MNPILLLGYGIAIAIGWWWLTSDILPSLRRASAPASVLRIEVIAFSAFSVVAVGAVVGWVPFFLPTVALVVPLIVGLGASKLIGLAGGPVDADSLRRVYYEILDTARRPDLSEAEFQALRRRVESLNRYRNPETDSFITLTQEELRDWGTGRPVSAEEAQVRDAKIRQLGDRLWLRPTAEDGQGPPIVIK
jgi:hypothetical protein